MSFQFRPILTLAAFVALAILSALGTWQLQRLAWKETLIAKVEARINEAPIPFAAAVERARAGEDMEYQPVFIDGAFDHGAEAHVFGVHEGAPGVFIFTPVDEGDGVRVFVNRGFVPQALRAATARAKGQVDGEVRIEGLFRSAETHQGVAALVRPKDQLADNLFFTRNPSALARARGLESEPYYIDSAGRENAEAWPKGGLTRLDFSNRHLEYALTWYGLGGALIAVFLAMSVRRRATVRD